MWITLGPKGRKPKVDLGFPFLALLFSYLFIYLFMDGRIKILMAQIGKYSRLPITRTFKGN